MADKPIASSPPRMRAGGLLRLAGTAFCLALCLALGLGCDRAQSEQDAIGKITFDPDRLDDDGLYGPPDGKRALSYEFCIPNTDEHETEASAIDPTLNCMASSPGRIGCGEDQRLCIGSTHQKNFRDVLRQLAELEVVERIDEAFFE